MVGEKCRENRGFSGFSDRPLFDPQSNALTRLRYTPLSPKGFDETGNLHRRKICDKAGPAAVRRSGMKTGHIRPGLPGIAVLPARIVVAAPKK